MKLQEGQRITLNPSGSYDWAPTRGSMDIRVPLHGQYATVIQTGATLAVAEIDGGSAVVVDRVNDPRVKVVSDCPAWATRLLRSARYNVTQIDADLASMRASHAHYESGVWTSDEMYHQGYQTGRKAELESLIAVLEMQYGK